MESVTQTNRKACVSVFRQRFVFFIVRDEGRGERCAVEGERCAVEWEGENARDNTKEISG